MQVQVGGLHGGTPQSSRVSQSSLGTIGAVGHGDVPRRVDVSQWRRRGAVEFVADDADGVAGGDPVSHRQSRRHRRVHRKDAGHVSPVEVAAEVEKPGALRDDRHPGLGMGADICRELGVVLQIRGVHLRESTAQVQALNAVRKTSIGEGIDVNDPEPGRPQHLGGLGVTEGEGSPREDSDHRRLVEGMALPAS